MVTRKKDMISLLTGVKSSKKNYYHELKRTNEELKKKNLQLEILNEVMKSMKIDMSINDMLQNIVLKLKNIIHFDRLSLSLLQDSGLYLTNVYPIDSYSLQTGSKIEDENSLYWHVLRERKTKLQSLSDESEDFLEKNFLLDLNITSLLVLPILSKTKAIGVLSVGCKVEADWESSDIAFLEQLANQLAVGIENISLYNQVLAAKKEWEDTFQAVDDKIIVFHKDLKVLQYNKAVERKFYNPAMKSLDFSCAFGQVCIDLVKETFHTSKQVYKEAQLEGGHTYEMNCYPIFNNQKGLYAVIIYIKNVTEKRKMEAQLIHSGKLAAIGEMAAGVAHELNSPLTVILGNSQLLLRTTDKTNNEYTLLQDIKSCGDRCKHIIKSLLTFSRQDDYVLESFSINEVIHQVLHLMRFQIERNQIHIQLELHHELPNIEGNQPQLEQVIINLLLNARDSLLSSDKLEKTIILTTFESDDCIVLAVKDNGIGIEESRMHEIFHPFHTTKANGTGLGLSVSLGIVKTHGGSLEVTSVVNQGSTFSLMLPVSR